MRVYAPSSSRPSLEDRNPINTALAYSASGVAPHGVTVRATYTVPTGRKARVEDTEVFAFRDSVATTAGQQHAYFGLTPSGGSLTNFRRIITLGNVVATTFDRANGYSGMLLKAADAITITTSDASTAGSYTYDIGAKYTEGDA